MNSYVTSGNLEFNPKHTAYLWRLTYSAALNAKNVRSHVFVIHGGVRYGQSYVHWERSATLRERYNVKMQLWRWIRFKGVAVW